MLRVLPLGIGRQWEIGIGKAAHGDSTYGRIAVSFPINIAAAFRAEMKSNTITAVATPLINLPIAFEPDSVFQVSRAEVEGRARPALARFAVAQVHLLGIARGDRPQRSAMAFCLSVHQLSSPTTRGRRGYDPLLYRIISRITEFPAPSSPEENKSRRHSRARFGDFVQESIFQEEAPADLQRDSDHEGLVSGIFRAQREDMSGKIETGD